MHPVLRSVFALAALVLATFAWKIVQLWRTQEPNPEPLKAWEMAYAIALIFIPPAGAIVFAVLALKP